MVEDPIVASISKAVDLLTRARFGKEYQLPVHQAQGELVAIDMELRTASSGSLPDGWEEFYGRAVSFLRLLERRRDDTHAIGVIEDVMGKLELMASSLLESGKPAGDAVTISRAEAKNNPQSYQRAKEQARAAGKQLMFVD
jgi:hypothetical protein